MARACVKDASASSHSWYLKAFSAAEMSEVYSLRISEMETSPIWQW